MEGVMKSKYIGLFLLICVYMVSSTYADDGPRVEMFSPQGTVKGVRQVSVRFSEQMVPFGDPRGLMEPFDMVCPVKGTSRWADGKNWIFDFEKDLPAGIRCEISTESRIEDPFRKRDHRPKGIFLLHRGPCDQGLYPLRRITTP